MNKTKIYNTGKVITRDELKCLIKKSRNSGDWSRVEHANVSKITDMSCLFKDVNGIKNLNLDGWDTSNVNDMGFMFYKSDYNHPLHLSVARACPERARIGYDTSNVTNMRSMFSNSVYNHPLYFDTSNVKYMRLMFSKSNYNHQLKFNTSNVKDMEGMFHGSDYNHPLYFDTSNVMDMGFIFRDSKYNHPLHFDTSNVTNMDGAFANSNYNHHLDLDTSKAIIMKNIFDNASITCPITFKGGKIPNNVQAFIDEINVAYEEKSKIDGAVHGERVTVSSFKL